MRHELLLSLMCLNHPLFVQTSTVEVRVQGSRPGPNTMLYISLLDEHGMTVEQRRARVTSTTTIVRFDVQGTGRYAVRAFQDENGNGKLDLGWFKIPIEGVAGSNDARGFMSAPSLEDLLFDVKGPTSVMMNMVYY